MAAIRVCFEGEQLSGEVPGSVCSYSCREVEVRDARYGALRTTSRFIEESRGDTIIHSHIMRVLFFIMLTCPKLTQF